MPDPVLEKLKSEICTEMDVPLLYFEKFLKLEEDKVQFTVRRGLLDDLRKLVAQTARPD